MDKDKKDRPTAEIGAYSPALTEEAWEKSRTALKDTPKGRAVIRTFSRGVMGASAFTLGGWWAGKRMAGYAPHLAAQNEVQYIAKFYDKVFGVPLKAAVNAIGRDGEKFVNDFRPTAQFENYAKRGRSLGHEVVMVTFDFGTMSIGDYWGRKIVHTLDPNKEKPVWKRDDGSIDWGKAVKKFGQNWWQAVTYAAGEDWAVAVPYCLTMRHIGTPVVDKIVPGYRFDFDLNGNGSGFLVNEQGHITGNMTTGGVLNLWERFTTYNVGTLLFRESYNWIGNRIKHAWKTGEMPAIVEPDLHNPNRSGLDTVTDGAKQFGTWITRGTAKALMYMIPAVPFFWVTRTPQHKYRGMFIHPEKGALMYGDGKVLRATTLANELHANQQFVDPAFTKYTPVYFSETKEAAINPFLHGPVEHNAQTWGVVDKALNPVAKIVDKVRGFVRKPIGGALNKLGSKSGESFADTYINAAIAYTPYFWAKSDWLADKWDYGRMDVGLERMIEGTAKLDGHEVKAGLRETWQALKRQPLKDPAREAYAQCREATDSSPSDNKFDVNPNEGESCDALLVKAEHAKKNPLSWRERVIQGEKPEIGADQPKSHSEREEMREALKTMQPPTNSIN